MSVWADGFNPGTNGKPLVSFGIQPPKCGAGNKPCGRRCIANNMECHIGAGRIGLAQKAVGLAAVSAAGYLGSRPQAGKLAKTASLLGGAVGAGLLARGSYNLGRSAGQSREAGALVKSGFGYPDVIPGLFFKAGLNQGRSNLKRRTSEGKVRKTKYQAASKNSILGMGALVNRELKG